MSHSVFVSHSSVDRQEAQAIVADLEAAGIPCWVAPRNVRPGFAFAAEIMHGIEESSTLVLLLSQASTQSPHVTREISGAAAKQKRIIVVRLDDCKASESLEYYIGGLHWISARDASSRSQLLRNAITSTSPVSEAAMAAAVTPSPVRELASDRSLKDVASLSRLGFDAVTIVSGRMSSGAPVSPMALLEGLKTASPHAYGQLTAPELVRLLKDADNHGFCPGLEKRPGGYVVAEAHIALKNKTEVETKTRMARAIASTLQPGMKIGLDGGSTTLALFEEVLALIETELLFDLTFVTNSMSIVAKACSFTADRGFTDATSPLQVYVIGGRLRIVTAAVAGIDSGKSEVPVGLDAILAETGTLDVGVVGANGITLDAGLTIPTPNEIPLKRALLTNSKAPFVLADGTKFGVKFDHVLSSWDGLARLVSTAPTTAQGCEAWDALQQSSARQWIDIV